MPRTIRAAAILAAFIAGALIPACSNQDDSPAAVRPTTSAAATTSAPDPAPTTTTPTPPPTPEDEVSAAYVAIMARYFERLSHPDTDDPTLSQDLEGASLDLAAEVLSKYLAEGLQSSIGPSGHWPETQVLSVALSDSTATVMACHVDDSIVKEVQTGRIINSAVVSKLTEAALVRVDGRWVLSDHTTKNEWQDSQGCRQ